eukprot:167670-Pelagomonas_calceolata.AAC.1
MPAMTQVFGRQLQACNCYALLSALTTLKRTQACRHCTPKMVIRQKNWEASQGLPAHCSHEPSWKKTAFLALRRAGPGCSA